MTTRTVPYGQTINSRIPRLLKEKGSYKGLDKKKGKNLDHILAVCKVFSLYGKKNLIREETWYNTSSLSCQPESREYRQKDVDVLSDVTRGGHCTLEPLPTVSIPTPYPSYLPLCPALFLS